jgi:hypothetical protein
MSKEIGFIISVVDENGEVLSTEKLQQTIDVERTKMIGEHHNNIDVANEISLIIASDITASNALFEAFTNLLRNTREFD